MINPHPHPLVKSIHDNIQNLIDVGAISINSSIYVSWGTFDDICSRDYSGYFVKQLNEVTVVVGAYPFQINIHPK